MQNSILALPDDDDADDAYEADDDDGTKNNMSSPGSGGRHNKLDIKHTHTHTHTRTCTRTQSIKHINTHTHTHTHTHIQTHMNTPNTHTHHRGLLYELTLGGAELPGHNRNPISVLLQPRNKHGLRLHNHEQPSIGLIKGPSSTIIITKHNYHYYYSGGLSTQPVKVF